MSGSVKAIDKASVHRITSGQVIVDLCSAVKELVENALDAGATSLEVRLKEHGSELIEVADNGSGIDPVDYESIALKYHTSKISSFEDVAKVQSFGFRGEALSSLCAVSTVVFTTRTREQDAGMKLTFDSRGHLQGKEVAPRSPGTTSSIKDLFKTLPVRAKAFKTNLKKEYVKLVHLLQAYAAVCTGVRFIATNQIKKAARTTIVSTQSKPGIKDNVAAIFGAKLASSLETLAASNDTFAISGVISSAVKVGGKTNGHPQFLFLNSRPVDIPKFVRVVNDAYRSLSSPALAGYKALFAINITVDSSMIDVNVTPDKRTVFVQQEAVLLDLLRNSLEDLWDPTKWQGAQSLAHTSGTPQQQQAATNTKQQSLLNPVRSKKSSAESSAPSQSTPLGPAQSDMQGQATADRTTAQPSGPSDAATATPGSASAPITPAPNGILNLFANSNSAADTRATSSVDPQHLTDDQFEHPADQHQNTSTPSSIARRSAASARGSSNPLVLSSPEASPDATRGLPLPAPKPAASAHARGTLAAALSGSVRSKASGSKNDSDFVRAATAAAVAAGAASTSSGAGNSAGRGAEPAGMAGSRLVLRSPNKPPRLLASGSTATDEPASRDRVDAALNTDMCEPGADPQGTNTAVAGQSCQFQSDSGGNSSEKVDACPASGDEEHRAALKESGVDAQPVDAQPVEQAQLPIQTATDPGAAHEEDTDTVMLCDAADDGVEIRAGGSGNVRAGSGAVTCSGAGGASQKEMPAPSDLEGHDLAATANTLHNSGPDGDSRLRNSELSAAARHDQNIVPAVHDRARADAVDDDVEQLEDNDGADLDVEMLQDCSDEEAVADGGSPKRPKRSIQCLSDSPDTAPSKQQNKAARSQMVPAPQEKNCINLGDRGAGVAAAGSDSMRFQNLNRGSSFSIPADGAAKAVEDVDMHVEAIDLVPSASKQDGMNMSDVGKENARDSGIVPAHVAAKQPADTADSMPDVSGILPPDSAVDAAGCGSPQQPAGERWKVVGGGRVSAVVDVAGMRARRLAAAERKLGSISQVRKGSALSVFKAASLQALRADGEGGTEQEAQAASELERRFNKKDFKGMAIHGQFNKGFIMASSGQELFIIDQHASDEKFNFERLQDTLVLNKQPLIVPVDLGLASVDDMTVRENMDVFEKNGFGFVDDLESGMLKLASVPFSKGTTFGPDDVHEMISMIHNGESTRIYVGDKRKSDVATKCRIRPSRVRAMLAMRACRGSIMVGTSLNRQRMQTTVERLADLDGPWNCPHGRPTLRHVHTLSIDA